MEPGPSNSEGFLDKTMAKNISKAMGIGVTGRTTLMDRAKAWIFFPHISIQLEVTFYRLLLWFFSADFQRKCQGMTIAFQKVIGPVDISSFD